MRNSPDLRLDVGRGRRGHATTWAFHCAISGVDGGPLRVPWMANFIGVDSLGLSALTREMFGWEPTNIGLIDDLDPGHYFDSPSAR